MLANGMSSMLAPYRRQLTTDKFPERLPALTDDELDTVVESVAEFAGVPSHRLRNRACTDRARPYRDALWALLNKRYGMSHRQLAKFFETSRTTVQTAIAACGELDDARASARAIIQARMNRLGLGI